MSILERVLLFISVIFVLQLVACGGDQQLNIRGAYISPAQQIQRVQKNIQTDSLTKFVQQLQQQKTPLDFKTVLNSVNSSFVISGSGSFMSSPSGTSTPTQAAAAFVGDRQPNQVQTQMPMQFFGQQRAVTPPPQPSLRPWSPHPNPSQQGTQSTVSSDLDAISVNESADSIAVTILHTNRKQESFSGSIKSSDVVATLDEDPSSQSADSTPQNNSSVNRQAKVACLDNTDSTQCQLYLILVVSSNNGSLARVRPYLFMKVTGQVTSNPDDPSAVIDPKILNGVTVSVDAISQQMTLKLDLNNTTSGATPPVLSYVSSLFLQKDIQNAAAPSPIALRPKQIGNPGTMIARYFPDQNQKWLEFTVGENKKIDISITKDFNLLPMSNPRQAIQVEAQDSKPIDPSSHSTP